VPDLEHSFPPPRAPPRACASPRACVLRHAAPIPRYRSPADNIGGTDEQCRVASSQTRPADPWAGPESRGPPPSAAVLGDGAAGRPPPRLAVAPRRVGQGEAGPGPPAA